MIAHVAEASEGRGRVVLSLGPDIVISKAAMTGAMTLAKAFGAAIESVFVDDPRFANVEDCGLVRIVRERTPATQTPAREAPYPTEIAARALHRMVSRAAADLGVEHHARMVRDERLAGLARACADNGPWNVVAVGEPVGSDGGRLLNDLFDSVTATTGMLLAGGAHGATASGPVVAVIEDSDRLPPLLNTALRLRRVTGGEVRLLLVSSDQQEIDRLDGEARLLAGTVEGVTVHGVLTPERDPSPIAEAIQRAGAAIVVVEYGRTAVPRSTTHRPLWTAVSCPLLIVR